MSKYSFPGYPAFLEAAAIQLGHPEAAGPARQISTLAALANLCAQAGDAAPEHVPAILARASAFRDQIHVALRAADLILADVSAARGTAGGPPAEGGPSRRVGPRGTSKGSGQ
jgi:hypothetical protein